MAQDAGRAGLPIRRAAARSTRWSSAPTTTRARPTRSGSTARRRTRREPSGSTRASTSTTWTGSTSRWPTPRSRPATTASRPRCGEVEFPVPADMEQEIPNRFPTADDFGNLAAVDPKVRVLQARDANGDPIFTMMNLADHNQELGHSDTFEESHTISSDWPGYFHRRLEQQIGGMAMFLAGDNGSQEDLITEPRVTDPACNGGATAAIRRSRRRASGSPTTSPPSWPTRRPSRSARSNGQAHGVLRPGREQPVQGGLRGRVLRRAPGLHVELRCRPAGAGNEVQDLGGGARRRPGPAVPRQPRRGVSRR